MDPTRSQTQHGANGEAKQHKLTLVAPTTPAEQVARARAEVVGAVPEIIHAFLEQAKRASCAHARFVFDFAGIGELKDAGRENPEGPSLAEVLTKGLGLREPPAK